MGKGGKDGEKGEDTIAHVIKDDKIVKTIIAKGGKPGQPGHDGDLSQFARSLTKKELTEGAGISTVLLVDMFRLENGLVTLIDAGWDEYTVNSLPFTMRWPIYLNFSVGGLAVPSVINCLIKVIDPNQLLVHEQPVQFLKDNEYSLRIPWANVLTFEANQLGLWSVEVFSGDQLLASLPIRVRT